jgi:hypothetical protein
LDEKTKQRIVALLRMREGRGATIGEAENARAAVERILDRQDPNDPVVIRLRQVLTGDPQASTSTPPSRHPPRQAPKRQTTRSAAPSGQRFGFKRTTADEIRRGREQWETLRRRIREALAEVQIQKKKMSEELAEMQAREKEHSTASREAEKAKARPVMAEKESAAPPQPPPQRSEASTMENHRISNIFPAMEADEFTALKADIAANGLREPIWTYQGAIIDGRHRERACRELGLEAATREWDGHGSLIAFVVSLNLRRRHLSTGQRAMIAVAIERELAEEARKRQAHGQTAPGRTLKEFVPEALAPGQARDEAARLADVNPHYVTDAKKLAKTSPELGEQLAAGKINIPQAKQQARAQTAAASNTPQADDADASIDRFDLTGTLVDLERLTERIASHDIETLCEVLQRLLERFKKRCAHPDIVIETNGQLIE